MRSHPISRYTPDSVMPPGFYIDEKLGKTGMTAIGIEKTPEALAAILDGQSPISPATGLGLERILGIPRNFWTNAERLYRQSLTRATGGLA